MPEKDYATTTDGSAKVKIDGTKFMVGDKELWFNGVNAPWDKWNDFGGGFNFEFWQDHFQKLHNSGVNAARIWIILQRRRWHGYLQQTVPLTVQQQLIGGS